MSTELAGDGLRLDGAMGNCVNLNACTSDKTG